MRYEGKEPCHGCGKSGKEQPRDLKTKLCYNCQQLLDLNKSLKTERKFSEYSRVRQWHHSLVSLEWGDKTLNTMLRELLQAIDNPNVRNATDEGVFFGDGHDNDYHVTIPTVYLEPLRRMFSDLNKLMTEYKKAKEAIPNEVKAAMSKEQNRLYNEGVERGRDLLTQLNAGDITVSDFEKEQEYGS